MSIRPWSILACVLAVLALPAVASADRYDGYDTDEQYHPGDEWPPEDEAPMPSEPEQDAPYEPETEGPYEPDEEPAPPAVPATQGTVGGKVAMVRTDGKAAIPRGAPAR